MIRRTLLAAAALGVAASLGAFAAAALGLPSISAARGHWAITDRMLQLTKRQSVALRSRGIDVPPLEDPALAMRGAGHFETACRRCHGVPGAGTPTLLRGMVPRPPDLTAVSQRYSPGELFTIVKHGIKMTGMPAWPAQQRDDEVWAMVAFLRSLPAGGGVAIRREAAPIGGGDASVPLVVRARCMRCHGLDGRGRGAEAYPVLGGQNEHYLYESLRAFAYGTRQSGIMMAVAGDLTDGEMRQAAAHYSRQVGLSDRGEGGAGGGAVLVQAGMPARKVPGCKACHEQQTPINLAYPRLAGQHPSYLVRQLELFAEHRRGGTAYAPIMQRVADGLTDAARRDASLYFGGR